MTNFALSAQKREMLGKSEAKKIKKSGNIPAIIYGKDGLNANISVNSKEFEKFYFKGLALTSTVSLAVEGKNIEVIAHKVELDPVTDRPIHIDFLPYIKGEKVRAKPKIVFIGHEKSPGLKKGGFLHTVLRRIEVVCDNADFIPNQLEVNIAPMHVGHKIRAKHLIIPEGVSLVDKNDFLIASILGRGLKTEEEAPAAAASATPAVAAKAKTETKK